MVAAGPVAARPSRLKGLRVLAMLAMIGMSAPAWAQVTDPGDYDKLIKQRGEIQFGSEGFGDQIDLSSGRLEIVQTDVDLPGNNGLPVRVVRRFQAADAYAGGHFHQWMMDLPSVHGTFFGVSNGWLTETYTSDRCTAYGKPEEVSYQGGYWLPDEYWHGTFFNLPGSGDQELLQNGGHAPSDGHSYHAFTKEGAAARCVPLAATSEANSAGEGFEIVTPDGVVYTLNQMVSRHQSALKRGTAAPSPGLVGTNPSFSVGYVLPRKDFFLFPTKVTDRFGNTVIYTWSTTNPWQLLRIKASDGRQLDFTYVAADSELVASVSDGTRTWRYGYAGINGAPGDADTVSLPDGTQWVYRLDALAYMSTKPNGSFCATIDGKTSRTTWDSGSSTTTGSITAPTGATVTYSLSRMLLGRSYVAYNCSTDGDDPSQAHPSDPDMFITAAVVGKTVTGPGLPTGGLQWTYAYGPSNNCWAGSFSQGIACTPSSPTTRQLQITAPDGAVTRYTFGNRANVDEGLLYVVEAGWNGTSALRTTRYEYADPSVQSFGSGWSPRGFGDFEMTSRKRPRRSEITTQQGRTFTWAVASDCSGVPYCFDGFGRPTKVIRSSSP